MGGTKNMMGEVAERMDCDDINDPKVLAEVQRLLSLDERRLVVIATHPNLGGCWIAKLGTESEVMEYLHQQAKEGFLDYVGGIIELKEKAELELTDWIEFEEGEPVNVRISPPHEHTGPTPPLPGLEKRLAGIEASAYGTKQSVCSILSGMYDQQIEELFSSALEGMLQSGRLLPKEAVSCQK